MAGENGPTDSFVKEDLTTKVQGMSFFQLVQLLERYHHPAARVGGCGPAAGEMIRFRAESSLGFPAADVSGLESISESPDRFRITTTFFGLYGTTSPLPAFYSEQILWREQEGNQAARDFLDVFHHRLLSLLYRSWLKYRYHFQFQPGGTDEYSQRLFALVGFGTQGLPQTHDACSARLLRYAGLLTQQPRSASALEGLLSDYFGSIPVSVEQCTGRWTPIKPQQRSQLSLFNSRLGQDCLIGERVYGRSGSFRVSVGPLAYEQFRGFFPGQDNFRTLQVLVRLFVGNGLAFDVELVLYGTEVPTMRLTSDEDQGRLGWSTWLPTHDAKRQSMKVVFPMETEEEERAVGMC
jgi:type VI secretion system protein ImpH